MLFAYLGTLVWQIIWLAWLPQPTGPQNLWLAGFACLPLLIPMVGILRKQHRSMIWGGVLLILYFTAGVTELWTTPEHRWPALVQITLAVLYLFAFRERIKAAKAGKPESA